MFLDVIYILENILTLIIEAIYLSAAINSEKWQPKLAKLGTGNYEMNNRQFKKKIVLITRIIQYYYRHAPNASFF